MPNFSRVWRTLQAYRDAFETGNARLVLTPDNDFLRYLQTPADARRGPISQLPAAGAPDHIRADPLQGIRPCA